MLSILRSTFCNHPPKKCDLALILKKVFLKGFFSFSFWMTFVFFSLQPQIQDLFAITQIISHAKHVARNFDKRKAFTIRAENFCDEFFQVEHTCAYLSFVYLLLLLQSFCGLFLKLGEAPGHLRLPPLGEIQRRRDSCRLPWEWGEFLFPVPAK